VGRKIARFADRAPVAQLLTALSGGDEPSS
jgi:hypothetical protein